MEAKTEEKPAQQEKTEQQPPRERGHRKRDNNNKDKYVEKGENKPKAEGEQTEEKKEHHDKGERKERPKRERRQREEYDYNPELITENTVVPKLPKPSETLKKPDEKDYKNREGEIIEKIKQARERRAKILLEKFERKNVAGKETVEDNIFTQFDAQKDEFNKIRDEYQAVLDEINDRKRKIDTLKQERDDIESRIKVVTKSKNGNTKENIFEKLRRMEHELVSASLTPKQEKELHREIEQLKSQLGTAASSENLEVEHGRLEERLEEIEKAIDSLYDEKKVFNDKYPAIKAKKDEKKDLVDKLKAEMLKFKEDRKNQRTEQDNDRDAFYEKKTKRKEAVDAEIQRYRDSIDALWDEYNKARDAYNQQQDLIHYIKWQQYQKDKIIRKKQWEEREKARQEREKEEQKREVVRTRKYDLEIKCCEFLAGYCERLKPVENKPKEEEEKPVLNAEDLKAKMKEDTAWKKEKELTVITSKKSQDLDYEIGNNKKKNKKQKQEQQQAQPSKKPVIFSHEMQIRNSFDAIKVLAPQTAEELDKTIQEIEARLAYYLKTGADELAQELAAKEEQLKNQTQETPAS